MKQQEMQERNSDIALMLGAIKEKNFWNKDSFRLNQFERLTWSNRLLDYFENPHFTLYELQFDSDWNWLMEAVEFIEKIYSYKVKIESKGCIIYKNSNAVIIHYSTESKLVAVFIAVSDFAKLYNNKEL